MKTPSLEQLQGCSCSWPSWGTPARAGAHHKAPGGDCNVPCQHITSLGKATVLPAPAGPSVADVAIGLSHWSVHLLSGLVWKGRRRLGILNNPEM